MGDCIKCGTPMVGNLRLKSGGYSVSVTKKGFFKNSLGEVCCAICPKCGFLETYIDDIEKIKDLEEE